MDQFDPSIRERLSQFLNWEVYAIETTWVGGLADMQAKGREHLAHQVALEKRGILLAAGPLLGPDDPRFPPKAGLIVVRAASFAEAEAIAKEDPMHQAGLRTFTIRKWIINEGGLTLRVGFSDRSVAIS